ncbi:SusC/RagA family TonB-linked outer membrane protein [Siphonobacter sp.]|uniref:SusC/RagA family TonB-linked outer membrane protein n=1 Tax=Siphonobacter sp. TaxID=1869184 RepID=UPI003B3B14B0
MKRSLSKTTLLVLTCLGLWISGAEIPTYGRATAFTLPIDRQITGTVTDEKGAPLTGATIAIKGTTQGSITDAEGKFTLSVPNDQAVLIVSYVGYNKKEITVGSQTVVNVSLAPNDGNLQEVVVTALGVSRESRTLGYAVSTINAEVMTKARETNIGNSLAGRVAGLSVRGTSGGPGSSSKLLLRGMPSMNSGGAPLIVINGVPMDNTQRGSAGEWGGADGGDGLGNLNPDDIENMTVLKGQSASALYGTRASNGVILITTKKGRKGDFSIDYNLNYTMDQPMNLTDFQYQYGQGQNGLKPGSIADAQQTARLSWGAKLDGSMITQFDGNQYAYSAQRNNIRNFYRTGSNFTNTVAVTKGGDNGSFRLSLSNLDNQAVIANSGMNRKTINLTADQNITSKLSVSVLANYINEKIHGKPQLSDGPLNANNGMFLATNIDQRILAPGYNPTTGEEIVFSDDSYVTNPYFVTSKYINNVDRQRLISMVSTKYQFADWIYAQARLGYDNANDQIFRVTPWGTAFSIKSDPAGQGLLDEQSVARTTEINVDGLIGVNKNITPDLSLNALLGANIRKNQYSKQTINGSPFVLRDLYSWRNVVNYNREYQYTASEVQSAYYSFDLGFKNFLNLTTTGRYDTYSSLPSNNRSIFTPSVSGAFVFTDLLKMNKLSFGKLRASYALTSGEPKPYQTNVYYSVGNSLNGVATGNFSTGLPNLFLKPFTKSEVELGLELKFFSGRLGIDAAYFTQETQNEIMNANYSFASGYTSGVVGTGSTQNRGLELQLTGTPIKAANFTWNTSVNLTSVKNKILKTDPSNSPVIIGKNRATLDNATTAFVVGQAGPQIRAYDYKYAADGQIVVDAAGVPVKGDLKNWGTVLPTLFGGWNNDFSYNNFNLSFLIDYNYGNKILSATEYYTYYRGLNQATLVGREANYITTGVTAEGVASTAKTSLQNYYQGVANNITKTSVIDGDFIKLRQITLGYNLPAKLLTGVPLIKAVNVSLVARNLFYIMKKAKNIDPESSFGANLNYYGIEGTGLPSARTYGVNLNIKFK